MGKIRQISELSDSGKPMYLNVDANGRPVGTWKYASGGKVPRFDRSQLPCPTDCGISDYARYAVQSRRSGLVQYAPGCGPKGCTPQNETLRQVAAFVLVFFIALAIIKA